MAVHDNSNNNRKETWDDGLTKDPSFDHNTAGLAFFDLISSPSIIAQNNSITEMTEIIKTLDETLEEMKKTAERDVILKTIPTVERMAQTHSSKLPGLILKVVVARQCYFFPILFYKKGASEDTEQVAAPNNTIPFNFPRPAEAYMSKEMCVRIENTFQVIDGKAMDKVIPIIPKVINIDRYLKTAVSQEEAIKSIISELLEDWYTGIWNFTAIGIVDKGNVAFPSPFKDRRLFGKEDTAVAMITATQPNLTIRNNPVPYNLQIKLNTTNKNGNVNPNSNSSKTICTTFVTVELELMSKGDYQEAFRRSFGRKTVGPLIPVISIGKTLAGEQMLHQDSIMTQILGLYTAISANRPECFTEAIRQKDVGNRGNLVNLAQLAYETAERMPPNDKVLTGKSMNDPAIVTEFLQQYVSPHAVYVIDIPNFVDSPSNNNFWWELINAREGTESVHYRTFMTILDTLSNGSWSKVVEGNIKAGQGREKLDWVPGNPIIIPTPMIIPGGIALNGKTNKWFDLRETNSLMMLRDAQCYGNNKQAVDELLSLIGGQTGQDSKLRQYNIIQKYKFLFNEQVDVDSWYGRFVFSDAFINTLCKAMSHVGHLTVNSNNFADTWRFQVTNNYLSHAVTTTLNQQNNAMGLVGQSISPWSRNS